MCRSELSLPSAAPQKADCMCSKLLIHFWSDLLQISFWPLAPPRALAPCAWPGPHLGLSACCAPRPQINLFFFLFQKGKYIYIYVIYIVLFERWKRRKKRERKIQPKKILDSHLGLVLMARSLSKLRPSFLDGCCIQMCEVHISLEMCITHITHALDVSWNKLWTTYHWLLHEKLQLDFSGFCK